MICDFPFGKEGFGSLLELSLSDESVIDPVNSIGVTINDSVVVALFCFRL